MIAGDAGEIRVNDVVKAKSSLIPSDTLGLGADTELLVEKVDSGKGVRFYVRSGPANGWHGRIWSCLSIGWAGIGVGWAQFPGSKSGCRSPSRLAVPGRPKQSSVSCLFLPAMLCISVTMNWW